LIELASLVEKFKQEALETRKKIVGVLDSKRGASILLFKIRDNELLAPQAARYQPLQTNLTRQRRDNVGTKRKGRRSAPTAHILVARAGSTTPPHNGMCQCGREMDDEPASTSTPTDRHASLFVVRSAPGVIE